MKLTLLKVKTKTCVAYIQTREENDDGICIASGNYQEIAPGEVISVRVLRVGAMVGDMDITEIV